MDPRDRREYRRRASLSIGFGLSSLPVLVGAFLDPSLLGSSSAAAAQSPNVVRLYLLVYLIGCVLSAAGPLWRPNPLPDVEAVGVTFLIFGLLVNAAAIFVTRGPIAGGLTAVSLLGFAWVFWRRLSDLRRRAIKEPVERIDRRVRDQGKRARTR